MEDIIAVFRMTEINPAARIRIIKRLGELINFKYASNVTEPLVYELVQQLDPSDPILTDENFKTLAGV